MMSVLSRVERKKGPEAMEASDCQHEGICWSIVHLWPGAASVFAMQFGSEDNACNACVVRRQRQDSFQTGRYVAEQPDREQAPPLSPILDGCLAIFKPEEQEILWKYREQNFAKKRLVYNERREVSTGEVVLQAMDLDKSTRLYLAARGSGSHCKSTPGESHHCHCSGGAGSCPGRRERAAGSGGGLHGVLALEHNFFNNLLGHRLYYGFRCPSSLTGRLWHRSLWLVRVVAAAVQQTSM
ncbi:hypothetical protein SELMODRAFT_413565 [Selaginella moellendorffii]|uniref:Uncharacterized protein n=1 Tax=Selaginella moellendorffii TaxID=88036 RepID=D8RQN8_SELML|nr:hypothetical protein SELMODRAFT_413565 [Selaginella moellendorffii]